MLTQDPHVNVMVESETTEADAISVTIFTAWDMETGFSVDFDIEGITATEGEDYYLKGATSGVYGSTVTFAPHEMECTFYIIPINDWVFEEDETFRVVLSNAVGIGIGPASTGYGTITDDDPFVVIVPQPMYHLDPEERPSEDSAVGFEPVSAEEERYVRFTIELFGRGPGPGWTDVSWTTSLGVGDTATADEDFESSSGTITVNYGEPTTIEIPLLPDVSPEEMETFEVTLTEASNNIVIVKNKGKATIFDPSTAPADESPDGQVGAEVGRTVTGIDATVTGATPNHSYWEGDTFAFAPTFSSPTPLPGETFVWERRPVKYHANGLVYGEWETFEGATTGTLTHILTHRSGDKYV
jgi:hypothetical protein